MAEQINATKSPEETPGSASTPCEASGKSETWGYDLYPDRQRPQGGNSTSDWLTWKSRDNIEQYKCEKKLVKIIKESPLVRIMIGALKKAGCPINFRRHIQCEFCESIVTGGYDPVQNQVVICYNTSKSEGLIHSVVVHELIHMFDYCTREMDFKNVEHIACSEIRAANLTYCSYMSAFYGKHIDRSKIRNQQKECVRRRASDSVFAVRDITRAEADAAVDKVFTKCYNDLEPIGRRIRRNMYAADLAYSEAFLLGYD